MRFRRGRRRFGRRRFGRRGRGRFRRMGRAPRMRGLRVGFRM